MRERAGENFGGHLQKASILRMKKLRLWWLTQLLIIIWALMVELCSGVAGTGIHRDRCILLSLGTLKFKLVKQ